MRIGHGYDVHRLVSGRPCIIGGVNIPFELGLDGHSDADVLTHAVMDSLLGALALGDIGMKAIVAVNDEYVCTQVEEAMPDCPTVREKFIVDGSREGWVDFDEPVSVRKDMK